MALTPMTTMLQHALDGGYALGYFEAWDTYSLEAVLEAAEAERSPAILGFGGMMVDADWLGRGGITLLGALGRAVAARATVPVCLLLNEVPRYAHAVQGIAAGFNAVMLDTTGLPPHEALDEVARLVAEAHARGVAVEAEADALPTALADGIDASHASLTTPEAAAEFVARTGVDCLAVSIGNVHLLTNHPAPVDLARLRAIRTQVSVPLVIHGGTGFPPEAVPAAIASGVAKFNVGTVLKQAFLDGVRSAVQGWPERVNVHDVLGSHKEADMLVAGKARMQAAVRERLRLYGSSGRATDGRE